MNKAVSSIYGKNARINTNKKTLSSIYGERKTMPVFDDFIGNMIFTIPESSDYKQGDIKPPHRTYGVFGNHFEARTRNMVEQFPNADFGYRVGCILSRCFSNDTLDEIDRTMHGISIFDETNGKVDGFNCDTAIAYAKEICRYVDPSILCVPDAQAAVFMTVWMLGIRKRMVAFRDYDFWKNTVTDKYEIHAFYHTDMYLVDQCNEFSHMITAVAEVCLSYYFQYGYYMRPVDVSNINPEWLIKHTQKVDQVRIKLGIDTLENQKEKATEDTNKGVPKIYLRPAGLMIVLMDNEPFTVQGVYQYWNNLLLAVGFSELYLTRLSESVFVPYTEPISYPKVFAIVPSIRMQSGYWQGVPAKNIFQSYPERPYYKYTMYANMAKASFSLI